LLYITISFLHREAHGTESQHAITALVKCYKFVFADTMDKQVLGIQNSMPSTLDDVQGWEDFVSKSDPVTQALYRRIDWHPPQNTEEGKEIASIELPNARAVLLAGGSAYTLKK
jgi:hypothetical protein